MDKKRWMLVLVLVCVLSMLIPVSAVEEKSAEARGSNTAGKVWDVILNIFQLKFISGGLMLVGFMRLVVFLLVFTLLFFGSQQIGLGRTGGIVAFLLAAIGVIFIPGQILLFVGEVYGTIFAWGLIVSAIFALFFIVYYIPPNTWWGQLLRIFILILLLWIFTGVADQAEMLAKIKDPLMVLRVGFG
jgi:hypothetical protein